MSDVKIDELFTRARAAAKEDPLLTALLDSAVAEVTAKALQIRSKADDPAPVETTETPAPPSAELTDAEADRIAAKVWQRIEAKFTEQQATVAKAAEPQTAKLESIEQTVVAIKASFDKLAGVQPAGEAYRASQAQDTIVNPALKADPTDDPAVAEAKAILAEANRIRGFVWGNNGGQH